jgi:hypothetical protein
VAVAAYLLLLSSFPRIFLLSHIALTMRLPRLRQCAIQATAMPLSVTAPNRAAHRRFHSINGTASVSADEFSRAMCGKREGARELRAMLEAKGASWKDVFHTIDLDQDGNVSWDEFAYALNDPKPFKNAPADYLTPSWAAAQKKRAEPPAGQSRNVAKKTLPTHPTLSNSNQQLQITASSANSSQELTVVPDAIIFPVLKGAFGWTPESVHLGAREISPGESFKDHGIESGARLTVEQPSDMKVDCRLDRIGGGWADHCDMQLQKDGTYSYYTEWGSSNDVYPEEKYTTQEGAYDLWCGADGQWVLQLLPVKQTCVTMLAETTTVTHPAPWAFLVQEDPEKGFVTVTPYTRYT